MKPSRKRSRVDHDDESHNDINEKLEAEVKVKNKDFCATTRKTTDAIENSKIALANTPEICAPSRENGNNKDNRENHILAVVHDGVVEGGVLGNCSKDHFLGSEKEQDDDDEKTEMSLVNLFLSPLEVDDFRRRYFRQRALHVVRQRQRHSKEFDNNILRRRLLDRHLFGGDVRAILQNSSTEDASAFVWVRTNGRQVSVGSTSKEKETIGSGGDNLLRSVEVASAADAHALYVAGHPTYCRAPPSLETEAVVPFLEALGSSTRVGWGEVEVFCAPPTNTTTTTPWHFDFQENFTVQLVGSKRWTLRRGITQPTTVGCTPHYDCPEDLSVVERQLRVHRAVCPDFCFGHPHSSTSSGTGAGTEEEVVVVLHPGDVLYVPAGMWHRVEHHASSDVGNNNGSTPSSPSLSVNVSLMAPTYAHLVTRALEGLLLQDSRWRRTVYQPPPHLVISRDDDDNPKNPENTNQKDQEQGVNCDLEELLAGLPDRIRQFIQSEGGANAILPPVLRYPAPLRTELMEDEENENCDENDDEENSDENEIIDVDGFVPPKNWTHDAYCNGYQLKKNPLATLISMDDINEYYHSVHSHQNSDSDNDDAKLYVLHVHGVGHQDRNEESSVRVILRERIRAGSTRDLERCYNFQKRGMDPVRLYNSSTEINTKTEEDWGRIGPFPPACLLFYGYFC